MKKKKDKQMRKKFPRGKHKRGQEDAWRAGVRGLEETGVTERGVLTTRGFGSGRRRRKFTGEGRGERYSDAWTDP